MSVQVPTTQELSGTIVAQLEGSLSQTIPLLPKAFSRVLAKVLAGGVVIVYRYAGFSFLQMFVAHATIRETEINGKLVRPLVEHGRKIGVGDPNPATQAEIVLSVTVLNQTGDLKAGLLLTRSQTGIVYKVLGAVALDAPTVTATVRAVADSTGGNGAGAIGNLEPGDTIQFANTPANVATDATVVSQTVAGEDAEDAEVYRGRVLQREQRRPQGGASADYYTWGMEVSGIANVFPYKGDPGEVDIYVEATEESSGDPDGVPTAEQLTAVEDSIEQNEAGLATRRPIGAAKNVLAITRTAFDVVITGLVPDTTDTREAIEEGLVEYLFNRKPFIVGLSVLPREDRITQAAAGGIVESIAAADGASVTSVALTPGPSYTLGAGELSKLGTITWT